MVFSRKVSLSRLSLKPLHRASSTVVPPLVSQSPFSRSAMIPRVWSLGLHALAVVSLSLKPQQGLDLVLNGSSFESLSNSPNSGNGNIVPPVSNQSFSSLTSNRSNLGYGTYECDGESYGYPPASSCMEAYRWILSGEQSLRYGDRTTPGTVDVRLPIRYSSSA